MFVLRVYGSLGGLFMLSAPQRLWASARMSELKKDVRRSAEMKARKAHLRAERRGKGVENLRRMTIQKGEERQLRISEKMRQSEIANGTTPSNSNLAVMGAAGVALAKEISVREGSFREHPEVVALGSREAAGEGEFFQ